MSIDYTTYLGPLVACKFEMVDAEYTVTACLNPSCGQEFPFTTPTFCDKCGSKIGQVSRTKKVPSVDQWSVKKPVAWRLMMPGGECYCDWSRTTMKHIWFASRTFASRTFGFVDFDPKQEDWLCETITSGQITKMLEEFNTHCRVELNLLRDLYGAANVEVLWGLVHYAS